MQNEILRRKTIRKAENDQESGKSGISMQDELREKPIGKTKKTKMTTGVRSEKHAKWVVWRGVWVAHDAIASRQKRR